MSPSLRRFAPALVAAAVLALVLGIVAVAGRGNDTNQVGAGAGARGSGSSTGDGRSGRGGMAPPSTPPSAPSPAPGGDEPQTRFTSVVLGSDGATLDVSFWGGVDTCYRYAVRTRESERGVSLALSEDRTTDGPCIDLAQQYDRTVRLDKPLGGRRVIDAATGEVMLPGPRTAQ